MKTKTTTRSLRRTVDEVNLPEKENTVNVSVAPKKFFVLLAFVVLFGAILVIGAKKFKSLVVAGMVNGKPVTRWELEKTMNDRYGKLVFDDIASNILLKQLADQNGVSASDEDVTKEITNTETRLGGKEALQSTLDRMGYTTARFHEEMKIQVLVQKLSEKLFKVDVTEDEITKFFNDNKTLFPQKTLAEVKADIKLNLVQQKFQQEFSTWFTEQKKKANIQSYL